MFIAANLQRLACERSAEGGHSETSKFDSPIFAIAERTARRQAHMHQSLVSCSEFVWVFARRSAVLNFAAILRLDQVPVRLFAGTLLGE